MALRPLNQILPGLPSDPTWADYRLIQRIRTIWSDVVGTVVAAHTSPTRIRQQTLQVATSTPAWAQNLVFQRTLILSKLNAHLTIPIQDIRFLPGEWHQTQETLPPPVQTGQEAVTTRSPSTDPPPKTPQEAFERWARRVKQSQLKMFPCPNCACPTSAEELDRWYCCGFCRIREMKNRPS